jgi:hypothetical protein
MNIRSGLFPLPFCQACIVNNETAHRNLGVIDRAFDGCSLYQGKIYTPEGLQFTPGELNAIPHERALIVALRGEIARNRPERAARRMADMQSELSRIEELAALLRSQLRR